MNGLKQSDLKIIQNFVSDKFSFSDCSFVCPKTIKLRVLDLTA